MVGLSGKDKHKISEAIQEAERLTSGEIRVHIKNKCSEDTLAEAKKVFLKLKMQKTKKRNAVLIFLALDSRRFAILGDAGIDAKVGATFWDHTRDQMAKHFSAGRVAQGVIAGVLSAGEKLEEHFPYRKNDRDELSNSVTAS